MARRIAPELQDCVLRYLGHGGSGSPQERQLKALLAVARIAMSERDGISASSRQKMKAALRRLERASNPERKR